MTRGRFDTVELVVCSDCAQLTANGDLGGVGDENAHAEAMTAQLGEDIRHLVISCTGDDGDETRAHISFSSRPCGACGSTLAGDRCPAVLLMPARAPMMAGTTAASGGPYNVRTWTDGFGRWHASVSGDAPDPRAIARRWIRRELAARGELGAGHRVRVEPAPDRWLTGPRELRPVFREVVS